MVTEVACGNLELFTLLRNVWGCALKLPLISGWDGKDSVTRLSYGICVWGRGAFQKLYFVYWNYYIWILVRDIVYLVIVSALCTIWLTRMFINVGLAELLCGFVKCNVWSWFFKDLKYEFNPLRIGLDWVNYFDDVKDRILLKFSMGCFNWFGFDKWCIAELIL